MLGYFGSYQYSEFLRRKRFSLGFSAYLSLPQTQRKKAKKKDNILLVALMVKNLPANAGDVRDASSTLGSGRSPGGGHGNPLQYFWLENPMDRGFWQVTVHGVTKSWTLLK